MTKAVTTEPEPDSVRVIDFFHSYAFEQLSSPGSPELKQQLIRPLLDNLEEGLLVYREHNFQLARLIQNDTDEHGYGGTVDAVGSLETTSAPDGWSQIWHFKNTWDNCFLRGSWIHGTWAGFSLLLDRDLVDLAKDCLDQGNLEPFDMALLLVEQEEHQVRSRHTSREDETVPERNWFWQEDLLPGEIMAHYLATLAYAKEHFRLKLAGIHGVRHWFRVLYYGLKIAKASKAPIDTLVLILFALLHDVERRDNGLDPEHGERAATLVASLQGQLFTLSPQRLSLLVEACAGHNRSGVHSDPTVQTCWDADRLDLGRVKKTVDPARLFTATGKRLALDMLKKNR